MSQAGGSLQNLNPIVLPDPVGLLPLAPGWKLLIVFLLLAGLLLGWRWWLGWRDQRYRRQALRAYHQLQDLRALPDLLKRTAISAYGRPEIAALTGPAWHSYLDQSAAMSAFSSGAGDTLDCLSYGEALPDEDRLTECRTAALQWLSTHASREAETPC